MEKSGRFSTASLLPYLLLVPQLHHLRFVLFFYCRASQAVWQFVFWREDAFRPVVGIHSVLRTIRPLFAQPEYYKAMLTTLVFSSLVSRAAWCRSRFALLFANPGPTRISRQPRFYKTFMIWPYRRWPPAVAGVLWFFMFHPSLGNLWRDRCAGWVFDWKSAAERQPRP